MPDKNKVKFGLKNAHYAIILRHIIDKKKVIIKITFTLFNFTSVFIL